MIVEDNPELALYFEEDQSDRQQDSLDWKEILKRDSIRRSYAEDLFNKDSLFTSNDFYHAAMIFQHGSDSMYYRLARDLSVKATQIDTTHKQARLLSAKAHDRYLLSIGEPQWYGTQFLILKDVWYLQEIDTTRVTDQDRISFGTRTLKEIRTYLKEQNGVDLGLNILPDSIQFRVL